MSRSVKSFLGVAGALLAASVFTGACGDSIRNNEGDCVAQATIDPASGCDAAKASYYTCPGARKPTLDAGSCTLSKVNGGFCCPLPTQQGNASQSGQIVDFVSPTTGISGATIDFGNGISTTSDSNGKYLLQIKQNTPFNMVVNAPNYTQLIEQEWELSGDFNAGPSDLVSSTLNQAVSSGLPSYDSSKGALGVGVYITGACKDNAGAIVALSDPSAGLVRYFNQTTPAPSATSVISGSITPSALIYNIDPATTATVVVTPPAGCTVAKFPFVQGPVTYTGNWKVVGGGTTTSFFRVFVQ